LELLETISQPNLAKRLELLETFSQPNRAKRLECAGACSRFFRSVVSFPPEKRRQADGFGALEVEVSSSTPKKREQALALQTLRDNACHRYIPA
jgi:hypothetical protein